MTDRTCLIGHSGFVGSNLLQQSSFDDLYRSSTIEEIRGQSYSLIVCAGVSAVKWQANKFPEEDLAQINRLLNQLSTVRAKTFVLISTVDVYPQTTLVDESFDCRSLPNHAYGTHRLYFEEKIQDLFDKVHTVRLPGLFGPGLKKNVIYDLVHDNCLPAINPASVFQYYDLRGLWSDIESVARHDLRLVNLVTEPVPTASIVDAFFPRKDVGAQAVPTAHYDIRTQHAPAFGKQGPYRFTTREVLDQLGTYLQAGSPLDRT